MSENGEIYSAGKNFTLPPALTAWTNSTSEGKEAIAQQIQSVINRQAYKTKLDGI